MGRFFLFLIFCRFLFLCRFGFSFVFFLLSFFYDKHFICKFLVVIKRFHRSKFVRKLNFNTDVIHVPNRHACAVHAIVISVVFNFLFFPLLLLPYMPCKYSSKYVFGWENINWIRSVLPLLRSYKQHRTLLHSSHFRREHFLVHFSEQKKGEKIPRHFNIKTQNFDVMHNQLILRLNDSQYPEWTRIHKDNWTKNGKLWQIYLVSQKWAYASYASWSLSFCKIIIYFYGIVSLRAIFISTFQSFSPSILCQISFYLIKNNN